MGRVVLAWRLLRHTKIFLSLQSSSRLSHTFIDQNQDTHLDQKQGPLLIEQKIHTQHLNKVGSLLRKEEGTLCGCRQMTTIPIFKSCFFKFRFLEGCAYKVGFFCMFAYLFLFCFFGLGSYVYSS